MSRDCRNYRAIWLLAALCSIVVVQDGRAAIFDFTANFTNNGVGTSAPFRLWLPNDESRPPGATKPVRGLVFLLPGAGESWLTKAQSANFQKAATALGFGLVSAQSMIWGYNEQETRGIVDSVLAVASSASSHAELVNAPFATLGVSQGGYNASAAALAYPERAIGFVDIRGSYGIYEYPSSLAQFEVPGLNIVGSRDGVVHPAINRRGWENWRDFNAPQAYAVEWNTTHYDTREGQSWEAAWHWIGESVRLRYSDAEPLSTIPGVRPQLTDINVAEGWIGHAPVILESDNLDSLIPTKNVEIDRISDGTFSEPLNAGSWLPGQGAANVYRAFTSYDNLSRPYIPRQGPLHFMSPRVTDEGTIETPLYEVGQTVTFQTEVHPFDIFRYQISLTDVDFYLNDHFLGNVAAVNNWSMDVTLHEPGIHAMIAIGHDAAGDEYPAFRTILVAGAVPEPYSLMFPVLTVIAGAIRRP